MRLSRSLVAITAVVGLLSLMPTGLAPAAAQVAGPQALRDIRTTVQPTEVNAGQPFTVIVDLAVAAGMHIQAAKPLQDYLIGTQLTAEPAEGIAWQEPRYPEPQRQTDPTLGTIAQYSGNVRIEVPGTIAVGAKPGVRPLKLSLTYQACTDKGSCFAPATAAIGTTLTVVSGQAAVGATPNSKATSGTLPPPPAHTGAAPTPAAPQRTTNGIRLPWEPFSGSRLAKLTAAGKTVLVDFTADWCPNCKLNEYLALNTGRTADLVHRNGIVPLLADFTRQDPEIRAWLAKFNSVSVPLTVILPAGRPTEPILLRDTYRQATLLAALAKAGPSVQGQEEQQTGRQGEGETRSNSDAGGQAAGGTQHERFVQDTQWQPLTLDTPIVLPEATGSIGWYLLAGFVGGFILNFMPCVLPVISIKVLSLLGQAGQARRRVLGLGLAFSAGMIALFVVLGLLVTTAGQTWGALFQSTTFLIVMLGVVVAMACSLFGAFTLAVPAAVGDADAAIEGEGYVGSFGKGVLAVLLGTPCSGPLLGSAMAWAAAKSAAGQPHVGMLVFVSMGLGMASPFLVLAAKPEWMRFLPRPGAWMETFKQAMGFLLLLTAVYVLYLLQDRILPAVLFSLGVAFAAWLYGRLVQPGRSPGANWVGRGVVVAVIAAVAWASFFALPDDLSRQSPAAESIRATVLTDSR